MINIKDVKCLLIRNKQEYDSISNILDKYLTHYWNDGLFSKTSPYTYNTPFNISKLESMVYYINECSVRGWDRFIDCSVEYVTIEDVIEFKSFYKENLKLLLNDKFN
jgi:fibronectin type 3 domain-containing protein